MTGNIKLTETADLNFAKIAQGALVNDTILPSGYKTPAEDMEVIGDELVPVDRSEWERRTHRND